ncbi:DMT family transporter [Streptomyces sp. NBC_01565]|uniref:DMT family transporter n=1 Tax=unclassified Streptomyces TaxID=2593676 RepID=UPI00224F92C7|nr:DMT family transporter [Streptomyces sp. NBC_01565]MCX4539400.1 DMT family transporter [Streptomyces sp. NBC_01565]
MTVRAHRAYSVGLPAALTATALWGFTFLGPAAVAPVNVYYLVVGRYAVFGLMSLAMLLTHRGGLRTLGTRRLLTAMHLGVVGYIGFYLLLAMSAEVGGGVLASTMTGLIPLMVTLVSNLLEKVLAWRRLVLPVAVISAGLLLVNSGAPADRSAAGGDLALGAALGFLASAAWSYFVIVNRRALEGARPNVDGTTWTACIGLGACLGSLFLLPLAVTGAGTSPFAGSGTLWTFLAWCVTLAVLGSWCATWFWNLASKRLPATVMGPVIGMEAVFGAAFNLVWEGRSPTFHELWGGLLVVAGVLLASYLFNRAGLTRAPARCPVGESAEDTGPDPRALPAEPSSTG